MSAPRLGTVPYLNVAPLIDGLAPAPRALVPAQLAEALRAGQLDAALVPVAEFLLHADAYALVDDVAVAARGPVYSVILIPEQASAKLGDLRRIALDPDSRSSVLLTRVLLEIGQGNRIEYVAPGAPADARLLIGDPALRFRQDHPAQPVLDLGEAWTAWTDLPFVFAGWVVRREVASPELADFLRQTKAKGLRRRPQLARNPLELRYLTEFIRYDLGAPEKAGLLRFAGYLKDLGLLAEVPDILWI